MGKHVIEVSFVQGVLINGTRVRHIFEETFVEGGFKKDDEIELVPGEDVVDIAFCNEIYDLLLSFGYSNVSNTC